MQGPNVDSAATPDFVALMRAAYSKCQVASTISFVLMFLIFVVALVSDFLASGEFQQDWEGTLVLIVGFTLQVCAVATRAFADRSADRGAALRQVAMMQNGLGVQPSPFDVAEWTEVSGPTAVVADYYESKEPPGPKRLAEITAESAFFSDVLARRSAGIVAACIAIGAVAVIVGVVAAVRGDSSPGSVELATKLGLTVLAFIVTGDLVLLGLRYVRTASNSKRVFHNCAHALESVAISSSVAYTLSAQYQILMASSPPMPGLLYKAARERLTRVFRQAMQGGRTLNSEQTR